MTLTDCSNGFHFFELWHIHLFLRVYYFIHLAASLPACQPACLSGLSEPGVLGVACHPQILANQLTLSQPGEQIMPTTILLASPEFQTSDGPVFASPPIWLLFSQQTGMSGIWDMVFRLLYRRPESFS